jgi:PBP1b-binding outer membrane lipoprotein LpoB
MKNKIILSIVALTFFAVTVLGCSQNTGNTQTSSSVTPGSTQTEIRIDTANPTFTSTPLPTPTQVPTLQIPVGNNTLFLCPKNKYQ